MEEPKKRGRKPKQKDEKKTPKKRGRKPKIGVTSRTNKQYSIVKSQQMMPHVNKSYIVTLSITSEELENILNQDRSLSRDNGRLFEDINNFFSKYNIPIYHKMTMPKIKPECVDFNFDVYEKVKPSTPPKCHMSDLNCFNSQWIDRRFNKLLSSFGDKYPDKSPYACWNCDNCFETPPIGIPHHIEGDITSDYNDLTFHLYGNFCSTNCAARWLFDNERSDAKWEQYSLLNILNYLIYELDSIIKVPLAPEKIFLDKFGGYMTIAEYREISNSNKTCGVFKPPMVPILFQMEESTSTGTNISLDDLSYIPLDYDKVMRIEKHMKNKRLSEQHNLTIDKCLVTRA
jgi:hypothetical protein